MRHVPLLVLPFVLCIASAFTLDATSGCAAIKLHPAETAATIAACTPGIAGAAYAAVQAVPDQNWAQVTASILAAAADVKVCIDEVKALNDKAIAEQKQSIPAARVAALPLIANAAVGLKIAAQAPPAPSLGP